MESDNARDEIREVLEAMRAKGVNVQVVGCSYCATHSPETEPAPCPYCGREVQPLAGESEDLAVDVVGLLRVCAAIPLVFMAVGATYIHAPTAKTIRRAALRVIGEGA